MDGRRLWTHPLSARFVDAHAWEGAILVADMTGLWLLDLASGRQRFAFDAAGALKAKGAIQHMVSSVGRAFVKMNAATVALDDQGRSLWQEPAGSPLAADAKWLLTHDRSGATVQVGLRNAATGQSRWIATYRVSNLAASWPTARGRPAKGQDPPAGHPC